MEEVKDRLEEELNRISVRKKKKNIIRAYSDSGCAHIPRAPEREERESSVLITALLRAERAPLADCYKKKHWNCVTLAPDEICERKASVPGRNT